MCHSISVHCYLNLDMNKIFIEHLQKLLKFLIPGSNVQAKTIAGNPILAKNLADYIEVFVNLLNSDKNLSPQSMFKVLQIAYFYCAILLLIFNTKFIMT